MRMAQLLIVDDEAHVVDRFAATIDWKGNGVEHVYKAYSGPEAVELLEQFSIDIVITDIKMPGMSGLELIAQIRRRWPKTKCVLLSGYSDFNYAKEAILYQTEDYLLKPVKEEDLLTAVRRVLAKLRSEWEQVISLQRMTYTLKENLPLLRANLLHDLLQGRRWTASVLLGKMAALGLPEFTGCTFDLMMIRLEEPFGQRDSQDLYWVEYAVGNMAEELFGGRYTIWHTKDAHDYLVFVMAPRPGEAGREDGGEGENPDPLWFERTAASLQTAVSTYLGGRISILVGSRGRFPEEVPTLYNRSVAAFRRRIGSERELFTRLEDDPQPQEIRSLQSLYEPPALIHLLEAARWDEIEEKLRAIFGVMEAEGSDTQEHVLEVYFTIASAYAYIAHKNGRPLSALIGEDFDRMAEGEPFRSAGALKEWTLRALGRIRGDMEQETRDSRTSLIRRIQAFTQERLDRDVSLQTVADHVRRHPVYVSKIYKLETGENLSDYVNRVRMEKAEYLLKTSPDKIYEIAERLGYLRPHSFNHAFKKTFGMTPQEYRERHT
ncbi:MULTISPECIES: response regulator [Paenibacillus]|uniref:response regulator n=1 Tax=Paenibacillus TaxID=44249 RepID=UPI0022B8B60C|nr:response regulator [Paenibacillus caseinilyticus]MCZ8522650.1 response regulator [Paenibacillus caseinilyticus]